MKLLSRVSLILLLASCLSHTARAQDTGERYALLIGGLGGTEAYTKTYQQHLLRTQKALVNTFELPPSHVRVLAEPSARNMEVVDGPSNRSTISAHIDELAAQVTASDHVYVVLFGHGSYDGDQAYLNIPGRDLSGSDYNELLGRFNAGRIVFINTASASAPFIQALSAPERIIITATRTGTQRSKTSFPGFLVEALNSAASDLDRNGRLSVKEMFTYTARKTDQSYKEEGYLASEHALLEDTGDGQGHRAGELREAGEGNLAETTYLQGEAALLAGADGPAPEQLRKRQQLRRNIADLKTQKNQLAEATYYARLERLFVQLARLNADIESSQDDSN